MLRPIVARGHGLPSIGHTPQCNAKNNLAVIMFDHLNQLFPAPDGSVIGKSGREEGLRKNGFVNGALGGQGE